MAVKWELRSIDPSGMVCIIVEDGHIIAENVVGYGKGALIVSACNSHDAAVELAELLLNSCWISRSKAPGDLELVEKAREFQRLAKGEL